MTSERFRCRHCGKLKQSKKKDQMYCRELPCQRARKNRWRREKYAEDLDYRLNQRDSTKTWLAQVGGAAKYHREYRRHRKRRRVKQEGPAVEKQGRLTMDKSVFAGIGASLGGSANSDATIGNSPLKTGRYIIFPIGGKCGANSDAIKVKIEVISDG